MNSKEAARESLSVPDSGPPIKDDEKFVIVGTCSGSTVLRESEVEAFHRGSRDFIAWALVVAVLLISAAVLLV